MTQTTRRRVTSALAVAGLAALAGLCLFGGPAQAGPVAGAATPLMSSAGRWWSASSPAPAAGAGQVALIAISLAAVGAFVTLQVIAGSRHRHPPRFSDWRTWPPGYDPGAGTGHDARDRCAGRRRPPLDL